MKKLAYVVVAGVLVSHASLAESKWNQLTPEEQAGGWKLLFDGKSLDGWRGFKKKQAPRRGWTVEDGCLKKLGRVRGGDIITVEQFSDFELSWEWRMPARANNGVKYFITEERDSAIGHEYQMIDDSLAKSGKHRTASFYDVLAPSHDLRQNPPGQWNSSRVVVRGNRVEHWLNEKKVLEYDLGSEQVLAAVKRSKFKDVAGFGTKLKGHILLTDHGDETWFRNIKIRPLPTQ